MFAKFSLFCGLLVQLHTLDWRPYVSDPSRYDPSANPYIFVDQLIEMLKSFLHQFPVDGFAPYAEWLETHRSEAPCARPSPIHWDFHPYNILIRDDGSAIVIDWTQIEISDSRFDLAWTLLLMEGDT